MIHSSWIRSYFVHYAQCISRFWANTFGDHMNHHILYSSYYWRVPTFPHQFSEAAVGVSFHATHYNTNTNIKQIPNTWFQIFSANFKKMNVKPYELTMLRQHIANCQLVIDPVCVCFHFLSNLLWISIECIIEHLFSFRTLLNCIHLTKGICHLAVHHSTVALLFHLTGYVLSRHFMHMQITHQNHSLSHDITR